MFVVVVLLQHLKKKKKVGKYITIIKVFVNRKIWSLETILSAYTRTHAHAHTHTHTRTHTHTPAQAPAHTGILAIRSKISHSLKRAADTDLRRMKTAAARDGKHGSQVCSFGEREKKQTTF